MNKIINVQQVDSQLLVSSREVTDNFGKEHGKVIRAIEEHIEKLIETGNPKVACEMFIESSYENRGKLYKEYLMNRDGFSLLVMSFNNTRDVLTWKIKYIEAFNKMEEQLKNPYANLSPELQMIIQLDQKQQLVDKRVIAVKNDLEDFKNNAPLFNSECDELMKAVKKSATRVLGGYKSNAYNDKSLRAKVYSDIQQQIRRQFGVASYKAIKRVQLHKAFGIVEDYEAPLVLEEVVEVVNNQLEMA